MHGLVKRKTRKRRKVRPIGVPTKVRWRQRGFAVDAPATHLGQYVEIPEPGEGLWQSITFRWAKWSSWSRSRKALTLHAKRDPRSWQSSPSAAPVAPALRPVSLTVPSPTACIGWWTRTTLHSDVSKLILNSVLAARSAPARAPTAVFWTAARGTPSR